MAVVPGRDLGCDLAFMDCLVRQHRLAHHVADGEDMGNIGTLLAVHGDESAVVHGHARGAGVQHLAVGPTPDRHKDLVEAIGGGAALVVLEGDGQPVLVGRDRRDLGLEQDLLVSGLDPLMQGLDDVLVGAGDDLVHQFHDRYAGPQRVIDAGHFQPDDAAAQNQKACGHAF